MFSTPSGYEAPFSAPSSATGGAWTSPQSTPPPGTAPPAHAPDAASPYSGSPYAASPSTSAPGVPPAWIAYAQQQHGDPATLDLPWYGIGFLDAIKRAHVKAFRYDGRASRGEYWWFQLYIALLGLALAIVAVAVMTTSLEPGDLRGDEVPTGFFVIYGVAMLVSLYGFAVGLSLSVRRLHDAGMSGWMYLLSLVPYAGGIILIVLMCQESKPQGQQYDRGYGYAQIASGYGVPLSDIRATAPGEFGYRDPYAAQQAPYAQEPFAQQPFAQQPFAQQPHAQQPYGSQPSGAVDAVPPYGTPAPPTYSYQPAPPPPSGR